LRQIIDSDKMDTEAKMNLLKRNNPEIVVESEMREVLGKKSPNAYIGYAPTGKIHIGYFVPVLKMKDFIDAGFKFTFLVADLHAHLDDLKAPWELLDARSKYYEESIKALLKSLGVSANKIKVIRGSDYQKKEEYIEMMMRLASTTTMKRCKRAAAEVVRFGDEPKLGGFIYPIMQSIDPHFLKADVSFGGVDQRGTYMFAREVVPSIGLEKPVCLFTPLIPGLTGGKMSASVPASKVDILDSDSDIKSKMKKAFCPEKTAENNGVLAYAKYLIFQVQDSFQINRPAKFGGNMVYESYDQLENDFIKGNLHPMDLKSGVSEFLIEKLKPVRAHFKGKKWVEKAYPK